MERTRQRHDEPGPGHVRLPDQQFADVAVIGVPDPDWGERVVAVVEGDGGEAEAGAIVELARQELAAYKRPKQVVFVDALPRNALGKVVKADVADLLR